MCMLASNRFPACRNIMLLAMHLTHVLDCRTSAHYVSLGHPSLLLVLSLSGIPQKRGCPDKEELIVVEYFGFMQNTHQNRLGLIRGLMQFRLHIGYVIIAAVTILTACERRTTVIVKGGIEPSFLISGSGQLGELIIFDQEQEKISDPFDTTYAIWKIKSVKPDGGDNVEQLRSITYGVIPSGYQQTIPLNGPAPRLVEHRRYRYWFITANAPHAAGFFEIRNGKVFPVSPRLQ